MRRQRVTRCFAGQCVHPIEVYMKRAILTASSVFLLLTLAANAQQSRRESTATTHIYELYCWEGPKGSWNFRLLPNTSSEKSVELVFDAKITLHGVDQLKTNID